MSQVQDIKNASDIVQLIGERVTLQRSGTNWRGLCPFHSEKSPSFFVSEQLQRYKCFGCGESGDVFTFLEKYDGMTFAEALQHLADRAGIKLERFAFSPEDELRQRVLDILNLAKEYYHFLLTKHRLGEIGRIYLKDRGVTTESIKLFQLGFAPPEWGELLKYLHDKKKFALRDIEAAGLILKGAGGRYYDRFRGRLMFPLTDHRGRVVGFSGRVLENETKEAKEAKYINSPETIVYHKSEMLFGFSQLYQPIRRAYEVVVVEGEFDVISSAQAHVNNVVAVKGSVLTEQHMRLLSRTVSKVILSFDMDAAGDTATKRAIEIARPFGLELRVIALPPELRSKDPDELARMQPQEWRQAAKSSVSVYDFFLNAAVKTYDPRTPEGKRKIVDELAPIFGQIDHAVELEFYTNKLAELLQVKVATLQSDLEKFKQSKRTGASTKTAPKNAAQPTTKTAPTRQSRLENYILFLLFNTADEHIPVRAEKLKHIAFAQTGVKQIVQQLAAIVAPIPLAVFVKKLPEDLQTLVFELSLNSEYSEMLPTLDIEKEWNKSITELINLDITAEIQKIGEELDQLERQEPKTSADEVRQNELLKKILQLRAKQKQL